MRRFSVVLLLLTLCSMVEAQSKKYPKIKFEQTVIDLGEFTLADAEQTCTFTFSNTGDAPLVINYVHPSCGCTGVDYPKDVISPGGKGVITVYYNGKGKEPGRFKRAIQVFSNCKEKEDPAMIFIQGKMLSLPREQSRQ